MGARVSQLYWVCSRGEQRRDEEIALLNAVKRGN